MLKIVVATRVAVAAEILERARANGALVIVAVASEEDRRAFNRILPRASIVIRFVEATRVNGIVLPAGRSDVLYIAISADAIESSCDFPLVPNMLFRVSEDPPVAIKTRSGLQKCLSIAVFFLAVAYVISKIAGT